MTWCLRAGIVEQDEMSIARQWVDKHIDTRSGWLAMSTEVEESPFLEAIPSY